MYEYVGWCGACGREHRLARTPVAEAAARRLLAEAGDAPAGGKMLGVLIVDGEQELRAFSGQLHGAWNMDGYVPPVATPDPAEEAATQAVIRAVDIELVGAEGEAALADGALRQALLAHAGELTAQRRAHAEARRLRRERRAAEGPSDALDDVSRQERRARKAARVEGAARIQPLLDAFERARSLADTLHDRRANASRDLMQRIHDRYALTSVGGRTRPMRDVFGGDMPSGTGDCCAPKLLHHAGRSGLRPVGLAEIWWGEGREHGALQPACAERCAPLLGHLLCDAR